jgi:hypothetical protein
MARRMVAAFSPGLAVGREGGRAAVTHTIQGRCVRDSRWGITRRGGASIADQQNCRSPIGTDRCPSQLDNPSRLSARKRTPKNGCETDQFFDGELMASFDIVSELSTLRENSSYRIVRSNLIARIRMRSGGRWIESDLLGSTVQNKNSPSEWEGHNK